MCLGKNGVSWGWRLWGAWHENLRGSFKAFFLNFHPNPWQNDPMWLAHIFQTGWKPPTRICLFFKGVLLFQIFFVNETWSYKMFWEYLFIDEPLFQRQKNMEMPDVSAWNICPISSPVTVYCIIHSNVLCHQQISAAWRDVLQLRSSVHGCLKSWVPMG